MRILPQLRAFLKRIFFWHDDARSNEFTPEPAHDHALVLRVTTSPSVPRWRQLRYVTRVLNLTERRLLWGMGTLLLVALVSAGWMLFRTHLIAVPANGGRVVEAVIGSPKYPHPFYSSTNDPDQDLVTLVYAGLFRRVNGSDVAPDLAERFEWSEDGKRLTVTLREGLRFHDGTPLTSDDVLFTFAAAKDPAWKSPYVNALRAVGLERVDDRAVAFTLERPDASLPDTLTVGILPAHLWQDIPPGTAHLADANIRPIGAGPFRVRSFVRDTRGAVAAYTLERSNTYHGIKPYLDQVELRFFGDRIQAEDALRNGQVDALAFVPGPSIGELTSHERLEASLLELPQETIAFFNVNDPLLKDVKIRQALSLAAEREDVADAQAANPGREEALRIAAPVSSPFPFMTFEAASSTSEERLDQARKLLDQAGWVLKPDSDLRTPKTATTSTAASTTLTLVLTVPDAPDLLAVAEVLQRNWSLLGARVEIHVEEAGSLARRIVTDRNAQILIWNVLLSPSQDQRPIWWSGEASGRGLNLSNLQDRNVDDALDAIRAATSTDGIQTARNAFTQAVLARTPAVFLTRPGYGYVHSVRLQGMTDRLQLGKPSDRFNDVMNWYVKTGWRWK